MVTKAQLSKIMRLAWQFIKEHNYTKGEALKTAWLNFRLKAALKIAVVVFAYRKKDGTTRKAIGTLLYPHSEKPQGESKASNKVQIYFDIEKQAWRSFNKWNLLSIEF